MGALSSSLMVPVAATPPTDSAVVSLGSSVESCSVGTVTVKEVTPAGTVITPAARVTPLEKVGALEKSEPAVALTPARLKE